MKNYIVLFSMLSLATASHAAEQLALPVDQEDAVEESPSYQTIKYGCGRAFSWMPRLYSSVKERCTPFITNVQHDLAPYSSEVVGTTVVLGAAFLPEIVPLSSLVLGGTAYLGMKLRNRLGQTGERLEGDGAPQDGGEIAVEGLEEEHEAPEENIFEAGLRRAGRAFLGGGGRGAYEEALAPSIQDLKGGYTNFKSDLVNFYGKHALWIVPAAICLWYGGGILKDQLVEYLNTPKLDLRVKWADDQTVNGIARQMVYDPVTSKKLKDVLEGSRNAKIKRDYFKNTLLYGPPGSGKRLFAEQLALYCHMDFYEVPWMTLNKHRDGKAIDGFFKKDVMKSKHGAVIFIDNAQVLFSEAAGALSLDIGTVVSSLIEHCQRPSKRYIVIFGIPEKPVLNNHNISVIDPAHIVEITRPAYQERLRILRLYRDLYFDKLSDDVQQVLSEEALQSLATVLDRASAAELAGFMKTVKNKSELPTSAGLQVVFDEEVEHSRKLYQELFMPEIGS